MVDLGHTVGSANHDHLVTVGACVGGRWRLALCVIALALVACGGSGSADPTAAPDARTPGPGAPTAALPTATTTPELAPSPSATAPTATVAASETPTSTATATASPSPTAVPREPVGELAPLDPAALTNFTLSANVELSGLPDQSDYHSALDIRQAAPDNYHLRSDAGGTVLETWLVDGTTYLGQPDGTIVQLPTGSDTALFSPAMLVQTIPTVASGTLGTPLGVETVGGRPATRYRIDADDFIATASWLSPDGLRNAEGQVNLWVDNEWRIILRQDADVRWETAAGDGAFVATYLLSDVLTTQRVEAPQ